VKDQPCVRLAPGALDRVALDAAVAEGRKIVARGPEPRGELLVVVEHAGLEGLEGDLAVPEIFPADAVEVVEPTATGRSLAQ
jgi:hypothetical protein